LFGALTIAKRHWQIVITMVRQILSPLRHTAEWIACAAESSPTKPPLSRYIQTHDDSGAPAYVKNKEYTIQEAVKMLLDMNSRAPLKFDATVELAAHPTASKRAASV
jgi:hypothetical protein